MKVETTKVSEEVASKVTSYVHQNYKNLKDKSLIITENEKCFYVYAHADGGPMILGKGIIK